MRHLSTIARIITPLAMVVFLAYEINRSMEVEGAWAIALLVGAIGTAIGIEIVGILAGHALEGFWRIGDNARAVLSFILLVAYTGTAVYILRHNQAMVLVPVIAAIVYLLASLTTNLEMTIHQQLNKTAVSSAFEIEEKKADRALERELKRQKQADATAVKLARIETKAKTESGTDLDTSKTDWRHFTDSQRIRLLDFTPDEIVKEYGVSKKTAQRWLDSAAKLSRENGHIKVAS